MKVRFVFNRSYGVNPSRSAWDMDAVPRLGELVVYNHEKFRVEGVVWVLGAARDSAEVEVEVAKVWS